MGVVCGLSCLFGVTQAFPSRAAQYMAALFFGPARTLQWYVQPLASLSSRRPSSPFHRTKPPSNPHTPTHAFTTHQSHQNRTLYERMRRSLEH
eukprot:scaffold24507_cov106-Isochrysis_galbana.AAC.1